VGLQLTNDCLGPSSLSPLISAQPFLDAGFSEIKLQSSAGLVVKIVPQAVHFIYKEL